MSWLRLSALLLACGSTVPIRSAELPTLDAAAARWVERTLKAMSLEDRVGQLVVPGLASTFLSTDTEEFRRLQELVTSYGVGGFIAFGGSEAVPPVLLNPTYGAVTLGQPLEIATTLNRLQRRSAVPLLNAADFEFGLGMRLQGGTEFPRAMAFGAAGDLSLAEQAGRVIAEESRAIGIHVNFAPVADVNNNPRNPVINTRSFGEDPDRVGALASAFVRGLQAGGVIATLKHFPGHGDTEVDTHLGLASVPHDRARLETVELKPFRMAMGAGAGALMVGHLELPAIDPTRGPATFSEAITTGLVRRDLGFTGLVVTDSMQMDAVAKMLPPGEAAVRAVKAGADQVLHSPDDRAAVDGLRAAARSGEISAARIDASVRRILTLKARLGLHSARTVDLEAVPDRVGGRARRALAEQVAERAVTLVRDDPGHLPLSPSPSAAVLYLSLLDYPGGWRIRAPGRVLVPELKKRWPNLTAIELSDRSTAGEIELVRASAARYDAIVAAVFVRTASASGRMDLSPALVGLVRDLAQQAGDRPFVTYLFGNPYVAAALPAGSAVLLAYDFGDLAEQAAARALAGEIPIGGRLPITLPGVAPAGGGLTRSAR